MKERIIATYKNMKAQVCGLCACGIGWIEVGQTLIRSIVLVVRCVLALGITNRYENR